MAAKSKSSSASSAHLGFEAKLWLAADTATRVSANRDCAAAWRDLRAAQDHRSNKMEAAELDTPTLRFASFPIRPSPLLALRGIPTTAPHE